MEHKRIEIGGGIMRGFYEEDFPSPIISADGDVLNPEDAAEFYKLMQRKAMHAGFGIEERDDPATQGAYTGDDKVVYDCERDDGDGAISDCEQGLDEAKARLSANQIELWRNLVNEACEFAFELRKARKRKKAPKTKKSPSKASKKEIVRKLIFAGNLGQIVGYKKITEDDAARFAELLINDGKFCEHEDGHPSEYEIFEVAEARRKFWSAGATRAFNECKIADLWQIEDDFQVFLAEKHGYRIS